MSSGQEKEGQVVQLDEQRAVGRPHPDLQKRVEAIGQARTLGPLSSEILARLNMIGESPSFMAVVDLITKFAGCEAAVLICGETGTGKELAARAMHYLGARADGPFVPVNCGALPEELIESELFGHMRGAFTHATATREGLVAQASGGTLFLDEIEAMTPRTQVALLRFLQDKDYRPVGASATRHADVRIMGATNTDLGLLARKGRFRSDLLFRLNVLPLHLPALREREWDVVVLAHWFVDRLNKLSSEPPKTLDADSAAVLSAHSWPGNVRELQNLIQREYALAAGKRVIRVLAIDEQAVAEHSPHQRMDKEQTFSQAKAEAVAQFEKTYIVSLLLRAAGNISLAARLSGKDRSDINRMLRKHGIDRRQYVTEL